MSSLLRKLSSPSLHSRVSSTPNELPNGDTSLLNVCQPRRSISSRRKSQNIDNAPKKDRTFQVFLTAMDDRIGTGPHAAYSGPSLLFDMDASQPDFSSLELAARMTLMFADDLYFLPLTLYGQRPIWNHDSLRRSALTFLRAWDVQYRCDVLPWTGWFSVNSKREAADFLILLQALYDGSLECEGSEADEDWTCFSRQKGVLRVDLTARFAYSPSRQCSSR